MHRCLNNTPILIEHLSYWPPLSPESEAAMLLIKELGIYKRPPLRVKTVACAAWTPLGYLTAEVQIQLSGWTSLFSWVVELVYSELLSTVHLWLLAWTMKLLTSWHLFICCHLWIRASRRIRICLLPSLCAVLIENQQRRLLWLSTRLKLWSRKNYSMTFCCGPHVDQPHPQTLDLLVTD